jgi:protease IV
MTRPTYDFDNPGGHDGGSARAPDATQRAHEGLERLVQETIVERRRARRWNIFLRLLTLGWFTVVILLFFGWFGSDSRSQAERFTALVELQGPIVAGGETSADDIVGALRDAFDDPRTAGVVLRINSPGGSPVQAGIIHDEIRRLRARHPDTPLYAVVDEICASGGYYVASAADRIFVDRASLVGSIGVLIDGFGFVDAMNKLGVERRLITAGENKGFMDSFSPLGDAQRAHTQQMVDEIHRQFIDVVRRGRGDRLSQDPSVFSGLVWTGERSIQLGLADGLGTLDSVARDVVKAEEVVDFSRRPNLSEKLARRVGVGLADAVLRLLAGPGPAWSVR